MKMHEEEVVTIAMLDARLRDFRTELKLGIAEAENRIVYKIAALGLAATGLIITSVFFMIQNLHR